MRMPRRSGDIMPMHCPFALYEQAAWHVVVSGSLGSSSGDVGVLRYAAIPTGLRNYMTGSYCHVHHAAKLHTTATLATSMQPRIATQVVLCTPILPCLRPQRSALGSSSCSHTAHTAFITMQRASPGPELILQMQIHPTCRAAPCI